MVRCGKRGCPHENFTSDPRPKHCSSCGRHLSMVPGLGLVCVQGTRGCFNDKLAEEQRRRNNDMPKSKTTSASKTKTPRKARPRVEDLPLAQAGLATFAPELGQFPIKEPQHAIVQIPVDKVDVPNSMDVVPVDGAKVEDIARSVRGSGLHYPIEVKARDEGRFELVDGRHRLAAFRALKVATIPALIRPDLEDNGAAAVARVVVNLQRRDVHPYEEAAGYQAAIDTGLTPAQVAQRVGVSEATVKARLQLLRLPAEIGKRVGTDGVTLEHAQVLLQLADHPKLLERAVEVTKEKNWRGEPMNAREFGEAVIRKLSLPRTGSWQVSEALRSPGVKKKAQAIPRARIAGETVLLDRGAWQKATAEYRARQKKRQASAYSYQTPERDWKLEGEIRDEVNRRELQAIGKAVQGLLDVTPAIHEAALVVLMGHGLQDDEIEAVSTATGIDTKRLKATRGYGPKAEKERLKLAREAVAAGGQAHARMLAFFVLEKAREESDYWKACGEQWTGIARKDLEAKVRAELTAAKKGAKGKGKAGAAAEPGQEPKDVEDQDAGEEGGKDA